MLFKQGADYITSPIFVFRIDCNYRPFNSSHLLRTITLKEQTPVFPTLSLAVYVTG